MTDFSKNEVFTDHPYNDYEKLLDKSAMPKAGYNTIEKMANSDTQADDATFSLIKGKNLIFNGKPHKLVGSNVSGVDTSWKIAKYPTNKTEISWSNNPGEPIHWTIAPFSTVPNTVYCQLVKAAILNNVVDNAMNYKNFSRLLAGMSVNLSLEVKSSHKLRWRVGIPKVKDASGKDIAPAILQTDEYIDGSEEWTKISESGTVPYNWADCLDPTKAKTTRIMIQFDALPEDLEKKEQIDVYVRNVKLEYGTEATDFSFSDDDLQDIANSYLESITE